MDESATPAEGSPATEQPVQSETQSTTQPEQQPSDGTKSPQSAEYTVPYSKFKETREELKALKAEQEAMRQNLSKAFNPPAEDENSLDPEAQKVLDNYLQKQGFVRKSDLEAQDLARQAQSDLAALKSAHNLSDDELEQVRQAAVAAGATNKQGLENAYRSTFMDKIVEEKVKEALATAGSAPHAEKPGPGSPPSPGSSEPKAGTSLKDRIRSAREKTLSS